MDQLIGFVTKKDGKFEYDGTITRTYEKVGMQIKVMIRSGETDEDAIADFGPTFIGHLWDARADMIRFRPTVNLSNRKRKLKTQEDITPENVHLIKDTVLTLRVIVGILAC